MALFLMGFCVYFTIFMQSLDQLEFLNPYVAIRG